MQLFRKLFSLVTLAKEASNKDNTLITPNSLESNTQFFHISRSPFYFSIHTYRLIISSSVQLQWQLVFRLLVQLHTIIWFQANIAPKRCKKPIFHTVIRRHLIRDDVAVQGRRNLWAGTIAPPSPLLGFEIREVESPYFIIIQSPPPHSVLNWS